MSDKPKAIDKLIKDLSRAGFIQPKVKAKLIEQVRQVALDGYLIGVQKGYEKLLQDHRDGGISLSTATRAQIDEAIKRAQDRNLMPGEFFSGPNRKES